MNEIFDRFNALNESSFQEFVNDAINEDLHLDFKTVDLGRKEHRKILAKAISGFANSDGGLVIWGVVAKKVGDDPDVAISTKPISPLSGFQTQLIRHSADAINPSLDGLLHKFFDVGGDSGYAVTYVPATDSGPHMAKFGDDRYYKRSGDQFLKMEHFEVADMFGRRTRPALKLNCRLIRGTPALPTTGTAWDYSFIVSLINDGRAAAVAPQLSLKMTEGYGISVYGLDGNRNDGLPKLARTIGSGWIRYGGSADIVIPPKSDREICVLSYSKDVSGDRAVPDLCIDYQIAALNSSLREDKFELSAKDIAQLQHRSDSP